jgi:hypothetical protein
MHAGPANTAIKSRAQCCHGVGVGANDESLDHRAGLAVIARRGDTVRDDDNGRTV